MEQKKSESSSSKFPREPIDGGVSVEQLKELLEAELSKDAAEIDTEYVDRLVALILEAPAQEKVTVQEESPSPAAPVAFPTARHNRIIRRITGIAAMLVLVCTITGITQAWVRLKTGYVLDSDEQRIEWQTNLGNAEDVQEAGKLDPFKIHSSDPISFESAVSSSGILLSETDIPEQLYGHPVIRLSSSDGYSLNHASLFTDTSLAILQQVYDSPSDTIHIQTTIFFDTTGNILLNTETDQCAVQIGCSSITEDHGTWSIHMQFNTGHYFIWSTSEQEIKSIHEALKGAQQ